VTDLAAHGIEISLPTGWEGRLFRRPMGGEVAAADAHVEGVPAAAEETTPRRAAGGDDRPCAGIGDFASGAVDQLGDQDLLIVVVRIRRRERRPVAVRAKGIPRKLGADDFSPNSDATPRSGASAAPSGFFNHEGRAFSLYVVLGLVRASPRERGARQRGARVAHDRSARFPDDAGHQHHTDDDHGAAVVDDDHRGAHDDGAGAPVSVLAGPSPSLRC